MKVSLAYGKGEVSLDIPDKNLLATLAPNESAQGLSGEDEVRRALTNPIGSAPLNEIAKPGEKIAIITSDITRPLPSYIVLPPVLEELGRAGVSDEDITIVFALGSHRAHTEAEMRKLVGDAVFERVQCVDSVGDYTRVGVSSLGTPYDVYSPVVRADRRICISNIEYHYFAGYSGGAKAIMPGVCARDAIQSNHSRMVEEAAKAGSLDGNPVREDIEEVTKFIGIDFIVNVVLDENKKIRRAVAGHHVEAHREGCAFLDGMYGVRIDRRADIVIVSPGGFPKDINLYQAQKALDNAKHAVRDGGAIIWVASAAEGLGESVFERWMKSYSPAEMLKRIEQNFELGGHKAAAISMILERGVKIYLVSDLPDDFVKSINFIPADSAQEAFDDAMRSFGADARVIAMPYGGSTLPLVQKS